MSISFHESTKVFTLNTKRSTYQCQVIDYGFLSHLYYGKRLTDDEITYHFVPMDRGFSGNPNDAGADRTFSADYLMQEYSSFGTGDYRSSAFSVTNTDGSNAADLRYQSHTIYAGKPKIKGLPAVYASEEEAQTLEILLKDKATGMEVLLQYSVLEELDIITRHAVIRNHTGETVKLNRALSCCLDFNTCNYDILTFYGRHPMERNLERTSVRHGKISIESVRGTSSHHHNPFMILCDKNADEQNGNCYGLALVYSGNFLAETEVDQAFQTRVVMGINPTGFSYTLADGEEFITPEVILAFSGEGFGMMSRNLHKTMRDHVCRGKYKHERRPILINNWEATYFDFDDEKLVQIAKDAAELGIEMLVMDDGWFGKRNDDNSGLGDWFVNEKKLKGGLDSLCRRINDLGLKMGIWFEPEMISEDSDLYRAHPDWALQIPGRKPVRSRNQLVLDMSRQDVRNYLFERLSDILSSANIEYVKWDMNRHLSDVWSAKLPPERQGEVYHRYVLGLYDLLERITSAFPDVLFEGCSGGGGRFDAGMLYYSPQIWCSDNTDAVERVKIQYGTSFAYPVSSMGAHVSACPNHQTGRTTPLETRAAVAYAGTFGYELDLTRISKEEKEMMKEQVAFFKKHYDTISYGDYYRLTNPFETPEYAAWQFVSEDGSKALLTYVQIRSQACPPVVYLKLQGLDETAYYQIEGSDRIYTGSALMYAGIPMPVMWGDYASRIFEIVKIDKKDDVSFCS